MSAQAVACESEFSSEHCELMVAFAEGGAPSLGMDMGIESTDHIVAMAECWDDYCCLFTNKMLFALLFPSRFRSNGQRELFEADTAVSFEGDQHR